MAKPRSFSTGSETPVSRMRAEGLDAVLPGLTIFRYLSVPAFDSV